MTELPLPPFLGETLVEIAYAANAPLSGSTLMLCPELAAVISDMTDIGNPADVNSQIEALLSNFLQWAESQESPPRTGDRQPLSKIEEATVTARLFTYPQTSGVEERREAVMLFNEQAADARPRRIKNYPERFWESFIAEFAAFMQVEQPERAGAHLSTKELSDLVREVCEAAAEQLDQAPFRYPLKPSQLASTMKISSVKVQDLWENTANGEEEAHLYSFSHDFGKVRALPTLASMNRAVLLADPGGGKTTILIASYVDHVNRSSKNVGVYARLSDVGKLARDNPPKTLSEAANLVVDAFLSWSSSRVEEHVRTALGAAVLSGTALFALDGLDEVYDPVERRAVNDVLRNLHAAPGQMIVTSRILGYEPPLATSPTFVVGRLRPKQVKRFLSAWFAEKPTAGLERVRKARRASTSICELMEIPLMAGLVAFVGQYEEVPTHVGVLYESYIGLFLERRWKTPDLRRDDVFEIRDLKSLAADIAWQMAARDTIEMATLDPDFGSHWTDTISANELVEISGGRPDKLQQLMQIDGLLTVHGYGNSAQPLLDQRYRWLHRTIHEHLVGAYVAQRAKKTPEAAAEFLIAALQSEDQFSVSIEHAFLLMETKDQDRVLERTHQLIVEGDPANLLLIAFHKLIALSSPSSTFRKDLAAKLRAVGRFGVASSIDFEGTVSALRDRNVDEDDADELAKFVMHWVHPNWKHLRRVSELDLPLLQRLAALFMSGASLSTPFIDTLQRLRKVAPVQATELAFQHAVKYPNSELDVWDFESFSANSELISRMRESATKIGFPNNLQLARLLNAVGARPARADFSNHPAYCVALLVAHRENGFRRRLHVPRFFLAEVLNGTHGDLAAFELARRLPASTLAKHHLSPWADAGTWVRTSAGSRLRDSINHIDSTSSADFSESKVRFQHFGATDLASPEAIANLCRSLKAGEGNFSSDQLYALVDLCTRVSTFPETQIEESRTGTPTLRRRDLDIAIHSSLERQPQLVLDLLTNGHIDLRRHSTGLKQLVAALIRKQEDLERKNFWADHDKAVALCKWGYSIGVDILSVSYPENPIVTGAQLVEAGDNDFLYFKSNYDQLAAWFWDHGSYFAWRDRILSLEARAPDMAREMRRQYLADTGDYLY